MTWSHRMFLEIPVPSATLAPYKLYKFMDARDPRHWPVWKKTNTNTNPKDSWWCLSDNLSFSSAGYKNETLADNSGIAIPLTASILYIPGHGGSYQQARSLGAHALGLTREYITPQEQGRILRQPQTFILDVYTVDFAEELTALHGQYARRQTEFVIDVIQHLVQTCLLQERGVVLVGHSMGGLVAVAAGTALPRLVHSIITLASPHNRPILMWDGSLLEWYRQVRLAQDSILSSLSATEEATNQVVIAVSGGLRDELLPPEATYDASFESILFILSSDIMESPRDDKRSSPLLGMAHRAIVWCHNVLDPIRRIVLSLEETRRESSSRRIEAVRELLQLEHSYSFSESVQQQRRALHVR
jgi:pimeloyl-ACP methyl ester carboxylesterase